MGKIPDELRTVIACNIRLCNDVFYPGRGGRQKAAQDFGVSPQQWSPWCRGNRTPDEIRLLQISQFFAVTVEWLRRDNKGRLPSPADLLPGEEYAEKREKWQEITSTDPGRFRSQFTVDADEVDANHQRTVPPPFPILPNLRPDPPCAKPYGIHIVASGTLVSRRYESELTINHGMYIPNPAVNDIKSLREAMRTLGHNLLQNGYTLRFEVLVAIPEA